MGYSRTVRVGDCAHVAGTTATDANGELVGIADAHAQTMQSLRNVGAGLEHGVHIRTTW